MRLTGLLGLTMTACAVAEPAVTDATPSPDATRVDAELPPPLGRPDGLVLPDFGRPRRDAATPPPRDAARPLDARVDDAARPADAAPAVDAAPIADARPPADAAPPDPALDAAAPDCRAEVCNGLDDDCNGVTDDGRACGPFVQSSCRLWMGWADERRGPANVSRTFGPCPDAPEHHQGDLRCTSTRGDGLYRQIDLQGDVDDNDQLAFAFTCGPAGDPVAGWLQTHCGLWVGWADERLGPADGSPSWLGCPGGLQARQGEVACTSTGFDGQFRSMLLGGDVDDNDELGFLWLCRDPADPGRAWAVTEAVEVFVGWSDEDLAPRDGTASWDQCPPAPRETTGDTRCLSTQGDGLFHVLSLGGDVNGDDSLGIALRARP